MASGSSVFISYAEATKPRAQELATALESQGIDAWVDFKDLKPGQSWTDELESAIRAARWLLILTGPQDQATAWQEREWSSALVSTWENSDKRVLPVVFGGTEAPPFLRNWVSLRVSPEEETAKWTQQVLDVLRGPRNEQAHDVGSQALRERRERFEELGRAVESLRNGQPPVPPVIPEALAE
jgi:hypothetical protein